MTYINISLDYLTENSTEQEIKSFLKLKVNGDTILNTINEDFNEECNEEFNEDFNVWGIQWGLQETRWTPTPR